MVTQPTEDWRIELEWLRNELKAARTRIQELEAVVAELEARVDDAHTVLWNWYHGKADENDLAEFVESRYKP
jgi:BMFP domain-containing protein YqiC